MAWLVEEHKLDDDQQRFLTENIDNQNVWIKGFPGSGKSVLLAYTVKRIKQDRPNASVVLVVFTHSLIAMFEAAFAEIGIVLDVVTYYDFISRGNHYDYVLCDEVQDLTPMVLNALKNQGTHVIVAGDENQSIYLKDPKYKQTTVVASQIGSYLNSRDYQLRVIHRLSKDIINTVQKFLPQMQIFNGLVDFNHASTQVRLGKALNRDEEVKYIMQEGGRAVKQGYTVGVMIPRHDNILEFVNKALIAEGKSPWNVKMVHWRNGESSIDYKNMNTYLKRNNIPLKYVGKGAGSFTTDDKCIVLMTYHSSKGLDFERVFLPFLDQTFEITPFENLSKTVFMVGMTRSRGDLYLTYSGTLHRYPSVFSSICHNVDIHARITGNSGTANALGF